MLRIKMFISNAVQKIIQANKTGKFADWQCLCSLGQMISPGNGSCINSVQL